MTWPKVSSSFLKPVCDKYSWGNQRSRVLPSIFTWVYFGGRVSAAGFQGDRTWCITASRQVSEMVKRWFKFGFGLGRQTTVAYGQCRYSIDRNRSIYPVQFTHRRRIHSIGIVSRDFHDKSHEIRCIIQLTQWETDRRLKWYAQPRRMREYPVLENSKVVSIYYLQWSRQNVRWVGCEIGIGLIGFCDIRGFGWASAYNPDAVILPWQCSDYLSAIIGKKQYYLVAKRIQAL